MMAIGSARYLSSTFLAHRKLPVPPFLGESRPFFGGALLTQRETEESRKQVRSEKACVSEGESPSSLEAGLLEFGTKVMNGKD